MCYRFLRQGGCWKAERMHNGSFQFFCTRISPFLPSEANTTLQHIYEKRRKYYIKHYFSCNTTDAQKDSSVIKRYQILKHDSWVCFSFNPEKLTRLLRIFVICRTFQIFQCAPYTTTKRLSNFYFILNSCSRAVRLQGRKPFSSPTSAVHVNLSCPTDA